MIVARAIFETILFEEFSRTRSYPIANLPYRPPFYRILTPHRANAWQNKLKWVLRNLLQIPFPKYIQFILLLITV